MEGLTSLLFCLILVFVMTVVMFLVNQMFKARLMDDLLRHVVSSPKK